ncbi:MAG: hypothetical protein DI535_20445 [Citrobacter freundii]|nr:MAG: hypothetical protein DI535_20445 [Citrobacter freundii]
MSLFKSSNPTLQEKSYEGTIFQGMAGDEAMTVKGTVNKLGFLLLAMAVTTVYSWQQFEKGANVMPLIIAGVSGGFVLAIIMMFKKQWSPFLAPVYALMEGLFVGAISAFYDAAAPGLPMQAVALTLIVALVMFLIYRFRIIRVTGRLRMVITIATISLALFYLVQWITFLIMGSPIGSFTNASTPLGIGFSVLVVGLASFNLLLNFDTIEKGAEMGASKYMEWYSAFGLLVTLVWLYLEILRLLAKLRD